VDSLAVSLQQLGRVQLEQGRAECVAPLREAIELRQRIGARSEEAIIAFNLGNAYLHVPALRDLDEAERWYQRGLELTDEHDQLGRAKMISQLGNVAYQRFKQARTARQPADVCAAHLDTALERYLDALALTPKDAVLDRAVAHHQLGNIYDAAGQLDLALHHYRQSLALHEQAGDRHGAGQTRHNIAITLANAERFAEARLYAQAALRDYEACGPSATDDAETTRRLLALIDQAEAAH
jgi:tetratricopeptide (TPR) repeat protein